MPLYSCLILVAKFLTYLILVTNHFFQLHCKLPLPHHHSSLPFTFTFPFMPQHHNMHYTYRERYRCANRERQRDGERERERESKGQKDRQKNKGSRSNLQFIVIVSYQQSCQYKIYQTQQYSKTIKSYYIKFQLLKKKKIRPTLFFSCPKNNYAKSEVRKNRKKTVKMIFLKMI